MPSGIGGMIVRAAIVAAIVGASWVWTSPAVAQGQQFGPWVGTITRSLNWTRQPNAAKIETVDEVFKVTLGPTNKTWEWSGSRHDDYPSLDCFFYVDWQADGTFVDTTNNQNVDVRHTRDTTEWQIVGVWSGVQAQKTRIWGRTDGDHFDVCRNATSGDGQNPFVYWEDLPPLNLTASGAADATSLSAEVEFSSGTHSLSEGKWTVSLTRERLGPPPPPPPSDPRGRVTWDPDAYPERAGQGVPGAHVTVAGQTFHTDAQGEYEIPLAFVGQAATVELPLFDHGSIQASARPGEDSSVVLTPSDATLASFRPFDGASWRIDAAAEAGRASATADSAPSLKVVEQLTLSVNGEGKIPPITAFGQKTRLSVFGQTFDLSNVRLSGTSGVEAVGGTAQLAFRYDASSPPIAMNVTIQWEKGTNKLEIAGTPGSTFQWAGQQATLTAFKFESPEPKTHIEATVHLSLGGVPIDATLIGDGSADGVVLTAKGQASVAGATLFFDEVKVQNGELRIKGRVQLPNQSVVLNFDTTAGIGAPRLTLPLANFVWDGQVLPVSLLVQGSALRLQGTGTVQLGGATAKLAIDAEVSVATPTVRASAELPLADGTAKATLEFDPRQPQNAAVTGTLQIKLKPCPNGAALSQDVSVRASAQKIALQVNLQVPIDCEGDGSPRVALVSGAFDGTLAQLTVSWPVTAGGLPGSVAVSAKGDGAFFEVGLNLSFKFGPGGGGRAPQVQRAAGAAPAAGASAVTVRVMLEDALGRRIGYDPATGQVVSEIPGATYDGPVDGVDSFTLPGRLGGYTATLSSPTDQQVPLLFSVAGGAGTAFTATVGPNRTAAVAAVIAPQNGDPGLAMASAPPACAPRPSVRTSPVAGGGALQVVIAAGSAPGSTATALKELRVGDARNAAIEVPGRGPLGANGLLALPDRPQSVTLVIRRVTPGQATHVPLTVVDECGAWPTFVGGGTGAGF